MGAAIAIVNEPEHSADLFAEFWLIYPRHVAKVAAKRAWLRLARREKLAALEALVSWRRVWLQRDEQEFIPHPASWLNGERWDDELPADWTARHVVARPMTTLPELPRKSGEIPDKVKAMLAKLRTQ